MEKGLFFKNREGSKLYGILAKSKTATPKCVLLCHGLSGIGNKIEIYNGLAPRLAVKGISSFRFDFYGHGASGGDYKNITLSGEAADIEAAFGFLGSMGYRDFAIVAPSFAAGPASMSIANNPNQAKAVVFWNPVLEYDWVFNLASPWMEANFGAAAMARLKKRGYLEIGKFNQKIGPKFIDEMKRLRPLEGIKHSKIPVLLVHGDKDAVVPCAYSVKYSKLLQNAQLKIITGAGHGFHDNPAVADLASEATVGFILKIFGQD